MSHIALESVNFNFKRKYKLNLLVLSALEELAKPIKKMPKQTLDESKFCQEMIEKYKNNYNVSGILKNIPNMFFLLKHHHRFSVLSGHG